MKPSHQLHLIIAYLAFGFGLRAEPASLARLSAIQEQVREVQDALFEELKKEPSAEDRPAYILGLLKSLDNNALPRGPYLAAVCRILIQPGAFESLNEEALGLLKEQINRSHPEEQLITLTLLSEKIIFETDQKVEMGQRYLDARTPGSASGAYVIVGAIATAQDKLMAIRFLDDSISAKRAERTQK
jgi:hypothetical protein